MLEVSLLLCKYFKFSYIDVENFDMLQLNFYINKLNEYLEALRKGKIVEEI